MPAGRGAVGETAMGETRGVVNDVGPGLRRFAKGQRAMMPRAEALFGEEVRPGRLKGFKFKRQVSIAPYVADFLCAAANVIVEPDGPPHDPDLA